jgi:hypothetical protein
MLKAVCISRTSVYLGTFPIVRRTLFCRSFNHFYVQPPYNPLIEDYTQIFYVIDIEDIPSIQCKMSSRGPNCNSQLVLFIISRYGPRRKHRSFVAIKLLLSDDVNIAGAVIGTYYSEEVT